MDQAVAIPSEVRSILTEIKSWFIGTYIVRRNPFGSQVNSYPLFTSEGQGSFLGRNPFGSQVNSYAEKMDAIRYAVIVAIPSEVRSILTLK